MAYLLGIDEAGYGPNLGPLVIGATVWQVAADLQDVSLYERLAPIVTPTPSEASRPDRLAIADSKQLYHSGKGLKLLERAVLAALEAVACPVRSWRSIWTTATGKPCDDLWALPWNQDFDAPLPCDAAPHEIAAAGRLLHLAMEQGAARLVAVRAAVTFPAQFNFQCERWGTKGAALSHLSLGLAAELLGELPPEPARLVWDKHGGRNQYGPLLQQHFPEWLIEVGAETRQESRYASGPAATRREFRFCAGGESFLPAALASMTAKYLRELAMRAFNEYWMRCVPKLAPTAGYPTDARRFRTEIAAQQRALGIEDRILWRAR